MEKKKQGLSEVLFELSTAELELKNCDEDDRPPNPLYLALLIKGAREKLEYYEQKYDFQVDSDDIFVIEDMPEFLIHKERYFDKHGLV